MILIATIQTGNETVGAVVLKECDFKTGSKGFRGLGKIEIGGKRYQAQCQLVEIGSKAQAAQAEQPTTEAE